MSRDRKNDIHYIINLNYLSAWCPMEMFSDADYFSLELGNISVYILIVIPLISLQQNFRSTEERTYWWVRCVSLSCTCGFSGCVKNLDYRPFYFFCWLLFQNQHFNLFPVFLFAARADRPQRVQARLRRPLRCLEFGNHTGESQLDKRNSCNQTNEQNQNEIRFRYLVLSTFI